jgi:hypothetical protein
MSELDDALREAQDQLAGLEVHRAPRQRAEAEARALVGKLIKRRQRVQQRGVPMWEAAQRAGLRMLVLAIGCAALITGATALDGTLGGVAIVVAMGLLVLEGMR